MTFHRILADLSNAVVWMVYNRPFIFKSSSPFINPLVTIPRAPIIIGINVTFMFHRFLFSSLLRSRYLFSFSLSLILICGQLGRQNPLFCMFSFFCWLLEGLVVWPRLSDPFRSQNPKGICVGHSPGLDVGLCIYHLFIWSNGYFLHNSQWTTLPTQSCLILYSFCDNLLYSLITWLMVSSLSWHNLHLLFCCILSTFALIWLVLIPFLSLGSFSFPMFSQVRCCWWVASIVQAVVFIPIFSWL